jgi:hypothetical protein
MTSDPTTVVGRCHCGNLSFELEPSRPPEEFAPRTCGCSFCRAHGGLYISDPQGFVRFTARDPARVSRYRFGHKTCDFLICADCGVFLGALMTEGDEALAVLNVRTCDHPGRFAGAPATMDYDAEAPTDRLTRRRARWTPAAPFPS